MIQKEKDKAMRRRQEEGGGGVHLTGVAYGVRPAVESLRYGISREEEEEGAVGEGREEVEVEVEEGLLRGV